MENNHNRSKQWADRNREHKRAYERAWRILNLDRARETERNWYLRNREKIIARRRLARRATEDKEKAAPV